MGINQQTRSLTMHLRKKDPQPHAPTADAPPQPNPTNPTFGEESRYGELSKNNTMKVI